MASQLSLHPTLDNHMATEDPTNGYKVAQKKDLLKSLINNMM